MSGFERVGRFEDWCSGLLRWRIYNLGRMLGRGDICSSLRAQVSAVASCLRDCRDGMFEDQLIVRSGFKQNRKPVETANTAGKLGAVHKIDHDRRLFAAHGVKKRILNILRRGFSVGHDYTWSFEWRAGAIARLPQRLGHDKRIEGGLMSHFYLYRAF